MDNQTLDHSPPEDVTESIMCHKTDNPNILVVESDWPPHLVQQHIEMVLNERPGNIEHTVFIHCDFEENVYLALIQTEEK